jgi:hypothetical protein
MNSTPGPTPNPRRVAAGRANRQLSGPLTDAGRERLREAALQNKPWLHSTGPRTPGGRARAARNGKRRQTGPQSVREMQADLREVRALLEEMRAVCQKLR